MRIKDCNYIIMDEYIVNWICISGKSLSGQSSEAKLVYCYLGQSCSNSKPFRDFVNENVLNSVLSVYPRSLLNSVVYNNKRQLAEEWGWLPTHPSFELWMIPEVSDKDFKDAADRKLYYDEKFPEMPAVPIKVYMEKIGSNNDPFSPFNQEIVLRYPLRMIPQEMDFVRAFHDFVKKASVSLDDIIANE